MATVFLMHPPSFFSTKVNSAGHGAFRLNVLPTDLQRQIDGLRFPSPKCPFASAMSVLLPQNFERLHQHRRWIHRVQLEHLVTRRCLSHQEFDPPLSTAA